MTTSSPTTPSPSGTITPSPGRSPTAAPEVAFGRVIVIVMENKDFTQVIGSADAPFINSLADRYGLALDYHAITHPSLPNYLALLGGSTFGIASNCTDCHVSEPSLVDGLEASGIAWRAYIEGLPSPCFQGAGAGPYAKKHNPFMYFDGITGNRSRCAKVVPLTQLHRDLSARALPRFLWITPDLCHDMHDCPISEGDRFLKGLIPGLLRSLGPRGVLFLTWDESSSESGPDGGRVTTIVAGPAARRGIRSGGHYTHYSLLNTIEEGLALRSRLPLQCECTLFMSDFFTPPG